MSKKEYKKICKFCGKEFITNHHTKCYCPDCDPPKWKCANCGKEFELNKEQRKHVMSGGTNVYCSYKCNGSSAETKRKRAETNMKLYGVENPFASDEIKEKVCKTNRKNLGVDYPGQSEVVKGKIRKTNRKNLGVDNPWQSKKVREKCRQTYKDDHGFEHPMHSEEVKNKLKETNKRLYGVEHVMQNKEIRERASDTYKNRTGYENPSQNPNVKNKKKKNYKAKTGYENPGQNPKVREKMQNTYKSKTGYANPSQNPDVKQKKIDTYKARTGYDSPMHNPEDKAKILEASKKAKLLNGYKSKNEIYFEEQLKKLGLEKNKDFYAEYNKDERYPFYCDFYLVKQDCFIELNCCHMHGNHWYNSSNNEDTKMLEILKSRISPEHPQYKQMVYVWTISDPKKREIAKQNNLNYVVLWNQKEIEKWFADGMSIRKDWKI